MADATSRTGPMLADHQGTVADLGHIATCLRAMTQGGDALALDETAAVYWLACLAAERADRLAAAISQGGTT